MKIGRTVAILVVVFIAACFLILAMLPSSLAACREGVDETLLEASPDAPPADETDKKLMQFLPRQGRQEFKIVAL